MPSPTGGVRVNMARLVFGMLWAVVLMTLYSVYTGTIHLEALSERIRGTNLLTTLTIESSSGMSSQDTLERPAKEVLEASMSNKVEPMFPKATYSASNSANSAAQKVDDDEILLSEDKDALYDEDSSSANSSKYDVDEVDVEKENVDVDDDDGEVSQIMAEHMRGNTNGRAPYGVDASRESLQKVLLNELVAPNQEMVRVPVETQDLKTKKLLTVLPSYMVTGYALDVRSAPSFSAPATGRIVHKGEYVVGARVWKKEYVSWLEMSPNEFLPLFVNPNTINFKKVAVPYLKLNSIKAFNERALEPLQDCTLEVSTTKINSCRRDNELRQEINRIIESYDVVDYAPKTLGATRGGEEEKRILNVIESLFEANAPYKFPKLEL